MIICRHRPILTIIARGLNLDFIDIDKECFSIIFHFSFCGFIVNALHFAVSKLSGRILLIMAPKLNTVWHTKKSSTFLVTIPAASSAMWQGRTKGKMERPKCPKHPQTPYKLGSADTSYIVTSTSIFSSFQTHKIEHNLDNLDLHVCWILQFWHLITVCWYGLHLLRF